MSENNDLNNATDRRGLVGYLKSHLLVVGIAAFLAVGVLGAGLKYLDEDAKRETARRGSKEYRKGQSEPFLNSVNPFLPAPEGTPAPHLSRSYVYAGSQLLLVDEPNASAAAPPDLAVWRPSSGVWWVMSPTGSVQAQIGWGQTGDLTVEGEYDGDSKTDFSVFRPATANSGAVWWILRSATLDTSYFSIPFGVSGDIPAQADFDGDGKTDIAIYRAGTWYIQQSSNGAYLTPQFGLAGDTPTPKDFDGDGKADLAVWRSTNSTFYSANSSNQQVVSMNLATTSTKPVPADYDGDGRADYAIRSGANWIIRNSGSGQTTTTAWQQASDTGVQNDFDGDGKVDIAVWRDDGGIWLIRQSSKVGTSTELRQAIWGMSGDTPVPVFFRR